MYNNILKRVSLGDLGTICLQRSLKRKQFGKYYGSCTVFKALKYLLSLTQRVGVSKHQGGKFEMHLEVQ